MKLIEGCIYEVQNDLYDGDMPKGYLYKLIDIRKDRVLFMRIIDNQPTKHYVDLHKGYVIPYFFKLVGGRKLRRKAT